MEKDFFRILKTFIVDSYREWREENGDFESTGEEYRDYVLEKLNKELIK